MRPHTFGTGILMAMLLMLGQAGMACSRIDSLRPAQSWLPDAVQMLGGVPVYSKFEQLSPAFEQDDDYTYVINFWATWCKPCVEELPYFEQLTAKYKDQKVRVLLVSMDFPKQLQQKLVPFVQKHQLQSAVVALTDLDYNTWIPAVDDVWGGAIPVTLIYKGKQRLFISEQFEDFEELEDLVAQLQVGE